METSQLFYISNLLSAVIVVLEICSEEAKLCHPLQSWKYRCAGKGPAAVTWLTLGLRIRRQCEVHLKAIIPVDCNSIEHLLTGF